MTVEGDGLPQANEVVEEMKRSGAFDQLRSELFNKLRRSDFLQRIQERVERFMRERDLLEELSFQLQSPSHTLLLDEAYQALDRNRDIYNFKANSIDRIIDAKTRDRESYQTTVDNRIDRAIDDLLARPKKSSTSTSDKPLHADTPGSDRNALRSFLTRNSLKSHRPSPPPESQKQETASTPPAKPSISTRPLAEPERHVESSPVVSQNRSPVPPADRSPSPLPSEMEEKASRPYKPSWEKMEDVDERSTPDDSSSSHSVDTPDNPEELHLREVLKQLESSSEEENNFEVETDEGDSESDPFSDDDIALFPDDEPDASVVGEKRSRPVGDSPDQPQSKRSAS